MSRGRRSPSRSRARSPRRGGGPSIAGIATLIALVGLLVGGGAFVYLEQSKIAATDATTFCRSGSIPNVTAILVDSTDEFDAVQKERITAWLIKLADKSPPGAKFELYRVEELGNVLAKPTLEICNPGRAKSELISDAKSGQERFEIQFKGALEVAFEGATLGAADQSPLIENIRSASAKAFSRLSDGSLKHFVIVSDMLQHSELTSHYNRATSFEDFKNTSAWSKSIADLDRTDVSILYVLRPSERNRQGRSHLAWWEDYFRANHAFLREVESF